MVNKKFMEEAYKSYQASTDTKLRDVYKTWSNKKEEAFENCVKKMTELGGHGLKIVSANGWAFSVGFLYGDPEKFVLITKDHTREIETA